MRRALILTTIVVVGLAVAGISAQRPRIPPTGAIKHVRDNLYVIPGAGGNTTVFVTAAGVVLVDTKLANNGEAILNQVRTVSDKPVTTIINTHSHPDHMGSNNYFPASVEKVSHENARKWIGANAQYASDPAVMPNKTFTDKITLGSGKDRIDLYYFGAGHTNGDTFVVFPALRTMHVGDIFAWKALPYVDADNGGSVIEQPKTLAKAIATVKNVDTIINGHTPVSTWNDLKEYAAFTKEFATFAESEMKAGKTVDQAAAEYKLNPKYKGYVVSVNPAFGGAKANLQIAYDEMKKK